MITSMGLQQLGFKSLNMVEDGDFRLQDDGSGTYIKEWKSASPQPTEAEIETAHAEWQAEHDTQEYARNRQAEYPSTDELIVALWENVVEERASAVVALEAIRQQVKARHPKP